MKKRQDENAAYIMKRKVMVKRIIGILLLCIIIIPHDVNGNKQEAAISYTFNGGRFGDTMLTLYKALWLSFKYKIPLLYKDFPYANQMHFHSLFIRQGQEYAKQKRIRQIIKIQDEKKQPIIRNKNYLYIIDYYTPLVDWLDADSGLFPKHNNIEFNNYLKSIIKPCAAFSLVAPPEGFTSVAVHVRKGSGGDNPLSSETCLSSPINIIKDQHVYSDVGYPSKFPPDSFYIESIKRISAMLNNAPLYVYLFTDDKNPQRLVDKYSQEINNSTITFACGKHENADKTRVLEDFFSMIQFDCLIRGDSSFSKAAHILADYDIAIYPEHYLWEDNTMIIDKVTVITKNK